MQFLILDHYFNTKSVVLRKYRLFQRWLLQFKSDQMVSVAKAPSYFFRCQVDGIPPQQSIQGTPLLTISKEIEVPLFFFSLTSRKTCKVLRGLKCFKLWEKKEGKWLVYLTVWLILS